MKSELALMDDFQRSEVDGKAVLVAEADAGILRDALLGKIQGDIIAAGSTGRGEVRRVALSEGHAAVRACRRGGMMGRLMGNRYFLVNRPLAEFRIHVHLFSRGLSVPDPLGVMWAREGLFFRGAIATRYVDGIDFISYMKSDPANSGEVLAKVGHVIRAMHDLGACHGDLNGGNILIVDGGVYIIDFDKATLRERVSTLNRGRNLLRLRRSMDKHGLDRSHFQAIVDAYGLKVISPWLSQLYRLKGNLSDALAGR